MPTARTYPAFFENEEEKNWEGRGGGGEPSADRLPKGARRVRAAASINQSAIRNSAASGDRRAGLEEVLVAGEETAERGGGGRRNQSGRMVGRAEGRKA